VLLCSSSPPAGRIRELYWPQSSGTATIAKQLLDQSGSHVAQLHGRVHRRANSIRYNPAPAATTSMPKRELRFPLAD